MARSPRIFIHNRTYEICFRTEEGLPFVPASFMAAILKGITAKAQLLYPVTLCHAVLMNNHPHLMIVVKDPEDACQFIGYIKRESAHAINRLLGRGRRTVWIEGYDSTLIVDTKKALERLSYFYLNPAEADLVNSIEEYPNLNTWGVFKRGRPFFEEVKRIPRDSICALPRGLLSEAEHQALADAMLEASDEVLRLEIHPDAWIPTMIDGEGQNPEMIRAAVIKSVREAEQRLTAERVKPVLGAKMLKVQNIRKSYRAKKRGRKTSFLSSIPELRLQLIAWRADYERHWIKLKQKLTPLERLVNMPPGIFAPGGKLRSNLHPALLPF